MITCSFCNYHFEEGFTECAVKLKQGEICPFTNTGAQRIELETPRYSDIPPFALRRLANICLEGSKIYGAHNWEKGLPYSSYVNHMMEHLLKWCEGDRSEDHLAKIMWGCMCLMHHDIYKRSMNDLTFNDLIPRPLNVKAVPDNETDAYGNVIGTVYPMENK